MHIAVITEYNPFHNGHEYQLSEIRKAFPNACITATVGGIFSQRGEPYITTPYVRAEAAILCGADLCLELPFPFSCAPASIFARAGVEIAAKLGADMLAFGSECGDIDLLQKILLRLDSEKMRKAVENESTENGKTRAYAAAYKKLYGEDMADKPNDILALEYLRAIKNSGYSLTPYTVKRVGDFKSGKGGFASATSLRKEFANRGFSALAHNIPPEAEEVFKKAYENRLFGANIENLSSAMLIKLCNTECDTAFSGGGLLNHIKNAAKNAKSIEEIKKSVSTKSYTHAEISRCMLYCLLDVMRKDFDYPVYYTKLLAANENGREILNRKHGIEIITKPSAIDTLSENARAQYERTFLAERAFALCLDGKYEFLKQAPRIK